MKYRRKSGIIDAELYKKGMEDGFDERYYGVETPHITWGIPIETENIVVNVPYINTLDGKIYINKGDYIITGIEGDKCACKSDVFEMLYEVVDVLDIVDLNEMS